MSIYKLVSERITQASIENENEIIGLLLGRVEANTVVIEDSVTGPSISEPTRALLPPTTIAVIANNLLTGKTRGNIIGWYHSHKEGGLFFSETDIDTQRKLQQFSNLIIGMVVDARTGNVGYFRVDPPTGKATRIPAKNVRILEEAQGEFVIANSFGD